VTSASLIHELFIAEEQAGLRLDKVLCTHPAIRSRAKAQFLIEQNFVKVNSKTAKASMILKTNDLIKFSLPAPTPSEIQPLKMKLSILFEDDDLLVVDKPAGLVVHPGAGHAQDTLVNAMAAHTKNLSMRFGEDRPGIVHRIDKDTSGLLVIAKNDRCHESLVQQFQARSIHRVYHAVVIGTPHCRTGRIASFLARHPMDRKRYSSIHGPDKKILRDLDQPPAIGKIAITHYETLTGIHGLGYMKLKLETGRTHQIRVHLSEMGHPIVGDQLYGAQKRIHLIPSSRIREDIKSLDRFLLHAAELGFHHPQNQEFLKFKVSWPENIQILLKEWDLAVEI